MGEFELIGELLAPLATDPGAFKLQDDASVIEAPPGHEAVITKDVMVAGVHFLGDADPARLAQKLLRVNLSDLAAMGADPKGYWLGLQLTKGSAEGWLRSFVEGLAADQEEFGISLMGGDTVSTPGPIALSLTAWGTVPKGAALRRNGAKTGDRIFVSGTIGDGMLGLKAARGELAGLDPADVQSLQDRLECPSPRMDLGKVLRGVASAAIDVSDGLAADAGHIAAASGTALEIDAGKVPLSEAAGRAIAAGHATLEDLLSGGDDYELLFTVPAAEADSLSGQLGGIGITEIGEVTAGRGVTFTRQGQQMVLRARGYDHF